MSLLRVRKALRGSTADYRVPRWWLPGCAETNDVPVDAAVVQICPQEFFARRIDWLLRMDGQPTPRADWSRQAVVYNLFVRSGTAFDHDGDGKIGGAAQDLTLNHSGQRETGTFLKVLAILPHLLRMGVNTLYLLPVTAVGQHGRKGELGSPYAIRNPERLEPTLADPLVGDLPVDVQFAALVEAAHRLGMRVVLEFVFRTAALDADWIDQHPNWFYWIDRQVPNRHAGMKDPARGFGAPVFPAEELDEIYLAVTGKCRVEAAAGAQPERSAKGRMHAPPAAYRQWFAAPPTKIQRQPDGEAVGFGSAGELRVPPAFADWPPDDQQPPWTDVTYLRMYDHESFNYMAYNTLRAFDPSLAKPANAIKGLWRRIRRVVPGYQRRFGIDGIMIDMGHALPAPLAAGILRDARRTDPTVAFWEENFSVTEASARSGYDAVVGGLIFSAHRAAGFREFIAKLRVPAPVAFFATNENHNTPRAAARPAGKAVGFASWALSVFLPGAIPFIHAGFELEASAPLNTGLDFTAEELAYWQDKPLALFDRSALPWDHTTQLPERIARVIDLRAEHAPALAAGKRPKVLPAEAWGRGAVAFRVSAGAGELLVAASLDGEECAVVPVPAGGVDLWSGVTIDPDEALLLRPGQWALVAALPSR